MKRLFFCISLVLLVSSLSFAQGIEGTPVGCLVLRIDQTGETLCLSLEKTECNDIWALHGWNSSFDGEFATEIVHGALHIMGEFAYIGLNGSHRMFGPPGAISSMNAIIELGSLQGDVGVYYVSGVGPAMGQGFTSPCSVLLQPCP
jgi:hypothetical protein